jgi:dynein heavy chain
MWALSYKVSVNKHFRFSTDKSIFAFKLTKLFTNSDVKNPLRAAMLIKTRLEKLKISLPYVQLLCNQGLKTRHWDLINEKIGVNITPNATTTLKLILYHEKVIDRYLDELNDIAMLASKEYALEQALTKMKSDWQPITFNFVPYKTTNLHILASFDDIEMLLGDHIVKTATMKNSPLIAIFQQDLNQWNMELVKPVVS